MMDKSIFAKDLESRLRSRYNTTVENASDWQLHECVSAAVMEHISPLHAKSL